MGTIKKLTSAIGLLVLCLAAHCQPVKKIEAIRFHTPAVQLSLVQAQYLSWQDWHALKAAKYRKDSNLLEATKAGQRTRGLAFEAVARDIYKEFSGGKSLEWVDATYNNGNNGIDGLALKYNKRGIVTDVHVIEVKSGNAHLGQTNYGMQLSKKWILHSLDQSIAQKTRKAAKLKNLIDMLGGDLDKKAKTSKRATTIGEKLRKWADAIREKLRKQYEEQAKALNENIKDLKKAKRFVESGRYKRYVVRVSYKDGRLVITQRKASEDADGKIKLGYAKKIVDFSYLEKDIATLKPGQLKWRNAMLKKLEAYLKESGSFTKKEVENFMKLLTTEGNSKAVEEAIVTRITTLKYLTIGVGAGFVLLSAGNEIKTIYDYVHGKINRTDLVFNSIMNGLGIATGTFGIVATAFGGSSALQTVNTAVVNTGVGSFIASHANIVIMVMFTTVDVIKNVYNISKGNVRTSEGVINIAANIVGAAAGAVGAWAGAKLGLAAGAAIGLYFGKTGAAIGGAIGTVVGGLIGGIGAFFTGNKATSGLGHLIVAKYDSYKEPERFHDYCGAVRQRYKLAG